MSPSTGSPCRERRPEARLRDRPGDDLLGDRLRRRARQARDRPQPGERADHAVGRPVRRRQRDRRQHGQGVGQGRAAPGRLAGQAAHGRPPLRLRARGAGRTAPRTSRSFILRKVVGDAEVALGGDEKITDVVITCPAYFGTDEREATANAGRLAGPERPGDPQRADRRRDRLRPGAGRGPDRPGLRPRRRHLRRHDDRDQGPPDPRHLHRRRPPARRRPLGRGDRHAPGRAVPRRRPASKPTRWTTPRSSTTCSSRPSAARRRSPSATRPRSASPTPASRPASSSSGPSSRRSPATCSTGPSS